MSTLVAQFETAEALIAAAKKLKDAGAPAEDALSPFPMPELNDLLHDAPQPRLRLWMAIVGFGTAALAYALEWYSATIAYPFDSGGRPLNSWPVFLLMPFEVGVLAGAIAGFVMFFIKTGLPRLHHPIFELSDIERATQDQFFLTLPAPKNIEQKDRLEGLLKEARALKVEALP